VATIPLAIFGWERFAILWMMHVHHSTTNVRMPLPLFRRDETS
jgi:hypothetical protein